MSLILFLILIAGMAGMMAKMMMGGSGKRGRFSYLRRVKVVFTVYLAVLILCMIVSLLLPPPGGVELKRVKDKEVERESQQLYELAAEGRVEALDPAFLGKKWVFDYDQQRLDLAFQDGNMMMPVIVKRKAGDDGKIEAAYYRARYSMNGFDITKLIDDPKLQLSNRTLTLLKQASGKLKFSTYNSVFSVKQLKGESGTGFSSSSIGGTRILFLSIPKNLELQSENMEIQYVES